jgi:hypothetical protein
MSGPQTYLVSRKRWSTMGIFDRAKDEPSAQRQQLDAAVENTGDFADETEHVYAQQVDKDREIARDKLADVTTDEPDQSA